MAMCAPRRQRCTHETLQCQTPPTPGFVPQRLKTARTFNRRKCTGSRCRKVQMAIRTRVLPTGSGIHGPALGTLAAVHGSATPMRRAARPRASRRRWARWDRRPATACRGRTRQTTSTRPPFSQTTRTHTAGTSRSAPGTELRQRARSCGSEAQTRSEAQTSPSAPRTGSTPRGRR